MCVNPTTPIYCLPGWFNTGTACALCTSPAATCASPTMATSCIAGFFPTPLSANFVNCTKCP